MGLRQSVGLEGGLVHLRQPASFQEHVRFSAAFSCFGKVMRAIEIAASTDNMAAGRVKN